MSFVDNNLFSLLQLFLSPKSIHFDHLPFNAAQTTDNLRQTLQDSISVHLSLTFIQKLLDLLLFLSEVILDPSIGL